MCNSANSSAFLETCRVDESAPNSEESGLAIFLAWIEEHKTVIRSAMVLMAVLSLAGPWAFDRVMVPAQYECSSPFIRLDDDFCGLPLSGFRAFVWLIAGTLHSVIGYLDGAVDLLEAIRSVSISALAIIVLAPIFIELASSLSRRGTKHTGPLVAAWALAVSLVALYGAAYPVVYSAQWGTWLYVSIGAVALAVELASLLRGARS